MSFTLVFSVGFFLFCGFFSKTDTAEIRSRQRVCRQSKFETWLSLAEILAVFSNFLDSIHSRHMNAHCLLLSCSRWRRNADGVRGLIKRRLQYEGRLTVMKRCTAAWDPPSWLTSLFVSSFEIWNSSNIKKRLCLPEKTLQFYYKVEADSGELHLSGLIGTARYPDMQKIRIIEFFFENRLNWQFEARLLPFAVCTCI